MKQVVEAKIWSVVENVRHQSTWSQEYKLGSLQWTPGFSKRSLQQRCFSVFLSSLTDFLLKRCRAANFILKFKTHRKVRNFKSKMEGLSLCSFLFLHQHRRLTKKSRFLLKEDWVPVTDTYLCSVSESGSYDVSNIVRFYI